MSLNQFNYFFFQAEDGIRDVAVTGVQTCALPILKDLPRHPARHPELADVEERAHHGADQVADPDRVGVRFAPVPGRSEEHTSELQSRLHLVCRLLLEKKKQKKTTQAITTQI